MFHGPLRNRIKVTEILRAPGGEKLSPETANWCAELLIMPDPIQNPAEYEIEKFLQEYDNPRGMPGGWIRRYLDKSKPQLAMDVIRAFDAHYRQEQTLRWMKTLITLFGTLNAFLLTVLALLKFL